MDWTALQPRVLRLEWTDKELAHEALYPLALRLPPLIASGQRPVLRRVPWRTARRLLCETRIRNYGVEIDGRLVCLFGGEACGHYFWRPWCIYPPAWVAAGRDLSRERRDALVVSILRAWPLISHIDGKGRPCVAQARFWRDAGPLEAAGWREFDTPARGFTPRRPDPGYGHNYGGLLAAFWRHIGVTTLEDALATADAALALANEWARDRDPSLVRAARMHVERWWLNWRVKRWMRN